MEGIFLIIIIFAFFIYIGLRMTGNLKMEGIKRNYEIFKLRYFRSDFLTESEKYFLNKNIKYYQLLDQYSKKKFEKRVAIFIKLKTFEARENLTITNEIILLISAAAIIVSFGLKNYEYYDFEKIIIYPDIYYSKFTHTKNKGETNPHGVIVISSKYAQEGFNYDTDCINLCYHEFAHALVLMNMNDTLKDIDFAYYFEYFSYKIKHDHLSQIVKEKDVLRDYAFTNKMEFFAVCVEYFFEDPEKLNNASNDLYCLISCMLNQDFIGRNIVDNFKVIANNCYYDNDDVYY